jgi:uncharacterized membrane protein (DUF441 family)
MKELTLSTILAVFEEMFGRGLFWGLVVLGLGVLAALAVVVLRDRGMRSGRLVLAEIAGVAGGIFAVWLVMFITSSRISDLGGPVDMLVMIGVWLAGAIGTLVAVYAGLGLAQSGVRSR